MVILLKDYETRSRAELSEVGQRRYAKDPSTEIMCIGWKIIGEKTNHIVSYPAIYTDDPSETKEYKYAMKHADAVVAHNAPFELAIHNHVEVMTTPLKYSVKPLDPKIVRCTMAEALMLALPASLEKIAPAIGLPHKKDTEGRRLMLKMCKPRRNITAKTNIKEWVEWVLGDENLLRLYDYCKVDLIVEELLFNFIEQYKPMTPFERRIWLLDQTINGRGFRVDWDFISAARDLLRTNEKRLNKELLESTMFTVPTAKSTKALRDFIESQGHYVPNVQKDTVDNLLKELRSQNRIGDQDLIKVLEIREQLGLSSTSKYEAFYQRADRETMRVCDNLIYHKASTGRWAGQGVQPQNFPRGKVKVNEQFFKDFKFFGELSKTHSPEDVLDIAKMFYPDITGVLSSMLRGSIISDHVHKFFSGDFSSIEARVLLWCAGDERGLAEYHSGLDSYISMAEAIYKVPYKVILKGYEDEVSKYVDMRQLGKKVILACGYQMGKKKFRDTVEQDGIELPEEMIEKAHQAFRDKYPSVPKLWAQLEKAAIFAALHPKKAYRAGKCIWAMHGKFLTCKLPSGRKLWYYGPTVRYEKTPWGETRPKLYHWGVDSKTKQWVNSATYGGKLTENIVQAISRDCMANSLELVETAGYECVLSVHDELITENIDGLGSLSEFKKLMATRPTWGLDIPLKVGAWEGYRYKK